MEANNLPPEDLIIRGSWILTMSDNGDIRDGAVHISKGKILNLGAFSTLRENFPKVKIFGNGSGIVTPGLINAHTHFSEALIPGMGSEMTLFEWGREIVTPVGEILDIESAREGTILKGIEMLHSGVTYVNDMFVHSNPKTMASLGVVQGLKLLGMRGCVSFGAEDCPDGVTAHKSMSIDKIMQEHFELESSVRDENLIDFRLGIGTLLGQTDKLFKKSIDESKKHDWKVHTHLLECREEIVNSSLRWGCKPLQHAQKKGLLDLDLTAAHMIWVNELDIPLLKNRNFSVIHNPVANMILGSGVCPVQRYRNESINVGIGTDGTASNDSQNLIESIKITPMLQKVHNLDPSVMSATDALKMATIEGAKALGISNIVGSIEVGKKADVVVFSENSELASINDPYQQIVYCTSPRSVSDVWVDGVRLLKNGESTTVNEYEQVKKTSSIANKLVNDSGLVAKGYSKNYHY
ncbi:MAG: amidohydrolase family protein [SAR324 cluster bacterium]|nr:amidohydrolase family protein [SAR324 cluster bacterium]